MRIVKDIHCQLMLSRYCPTSFLSLADFRKGASAEVVKEVGQLLKSYQEEIDRLTARAKLGESAFLDVYQRLYEAPDPAVALMAGLVRRIARTEGFRNVRKSPPQIVLILAPRSDHPNSSGNSVMLRRKALTDVVQPPQDMLCAEASYIGQLSEA